MYACHTYETAAAGANPANFRHGPPLPLKLLGVGVAFLISRPLGVIALGLALWSHFRHRGFGPGPSFGPRRSGFGGSGNAAFDDGQRETLMKMQEDAKAFAEFRQRQRDARDKEAFDRFTSERGGGAA
ncbi:MAG: DUF2852 domain-containing protein [Roseiarcus sp.]